MLAVRVDVLGAVLPELKVWCRFCRSWDEVLNNCKKNGLFAEEFNWCEGFKEKARGEGEEMSEPKPTLLREVLTESEKKRRKQEFEKAVSEVVGKIPDNICCCCGHKLGNHVDERDGWRCHSLGQDFYQCECYLRKNRYDSISGYDLKLRVIRMKKDLKKEVGLK